MASDLIGYLIGIMVTLALFTLVQLMAGIWWASTISTTLNFIKSGLEGVTKSIDDEQLRREKQIGKLWERLDEQRILIEQKVNKNG